MSRPPATLDPTKLTFAPDETYLSRGRLCVTATYPSDSTSGKDYTLTARDDGAFISGGDHDDARPEDSPCPGFRRYGACLHTRGGPEVMREYWRQEFRRLPSTDLVREDSWIAHQPALDAAQQLQSDALDDVVAERYAATHGRVEVQVAS